MATLSQYRTILRNLIQAPTSPVPLLPDALLDQYINLARTQIAAMGECVPGYGVLEVGPGDQHYPFTAISFPGDINAGIKGAIALRLVFWQVGEGQKRLYAQDWPRFSSFTLGQPVPKRGQPKAWSQYGQGTGGSFFINALDGNYRLTMDCRCLPADLTSDASADAVPELWTDAVPFRAAWYCFMTMQRQADADHFEQRFQAKMQEARAGATPAVGITTSVQAPDPFMAGRLGLNQGQRGAHPRQQTPPTAA